VKGVFDEYTVIMTMVNRRAERIHDKGLICGNKAHYLNCDIVMFLKL